MLFRFSDCVLDTDRRELARGPQAISLGPQVFDLLVYLLQNRERVVSKSDLFSAIWQSRTISESTLTSHINAVRKAVGDNGADQRLIRTIARKGFRFVGDVGASTQAADNELVALSPLSTPADRPSIAVLPFLNLSDDPTQEYFADGMAEEIITGLSRIKWLFVIARNSSFTYKGRAVDIKQVGRELGVRYVLEGSVRKVASRLRIAGQLIDAANGAHLWADRFDGSLEDIFELQDHVTTSVVSAIAPKLEHAEIERAKRKPTKSLDAYDYFLRGMENNDRQTRESVDEALRLFHKAIKFDSHFAAAYGMAAFCYVWRKAGGWVTDRAHEIAEASVLARRAVELGKDDAIALSRAGHALAYVVDDFDAGVLFIDRALVLNPNLASARFSSAWARLWIGEPEIAIQHLARYMRISPLDPVLPWIRSASAFAHVFAGRYDEAVQFAEQALREKPNSHQVLRSAALSYALAGRLEQASKAMARLRKIDPGLRISNLKNVMPLQRSQDIAKFAEGLRMAGLPE